MRHMAPRSRGGFSQQRGSSYTCPLHPNPIVPKDQCPGVGPAPKQSSWGPWEGGLLMGTSRLQVVLRHPHPKELCSWQESDALRKLAVGAIVRMLLRHLLEPWLP